MNEHDFTTANCGNMLALTPMSAKANQAVAEGLIDFQDWQVRGGSILIDLHMAGDLIANLRRDGFTVAPEGYDEAEAAAVRETINAQWWYVWIDGIPDELSKTAEDLICRDNRSETDWMPLVLCEDEARADAVADALEKDQSGTIKRWNLTVYRNPLAEQKSPEDISSIVDTTLELTRRAATPGALHSQLSILVRRAAELKNRTEAQP